MERMIVTTFGTDAEAQRGVSALKDLESPLATSRCMVS